MYTLGEIERERERGRDEELQTIVWPLISIYVKKGRHGYMRGIQGTML